MAREEVLANFYEQWKHDNLVVLKWLGMQASGSGMTVEGMQKLMAHEAFELKVDALRTHHNGPFLPCALPVGVACVYVGGGGLGHYSSLSGP